MSDSDQDKDLDLEKNQETNQDTKDNSSDQQNADNISENNTSASSEQEMQPDDRAKKENTASNLPHKDLVRDDNDDEDEEDDEDDDDNSKFTLNGRITVGANKVLPDASKLRPERTFVVPVFGRPFLPGLILPVQVASKPWKTTFEKVLSTKHKTLALFCVTADSDNDDEDSKQIIEKENDLISRIPKTGCLIRIIHARINENEIQFIAEGVSRVQIKEFLTTENPPFLAELTYPQVTNENNASIADIKAHAMAIINTIRELLPLNHLYSDEIKQFTLKFSPNRPAELADGAASITTASGRDLQEVLDTMDISARLKKCTELLLKELEIAKLQNDIRNTVDEKIQKRQRRYYLKEQLKIIQQELGTGEDEDMGVLNKSLLDFLMKLEQRCLKLKMPSEVQEKYEDELNKLKLINPSSPEYEVVCTYLDWITRIPWGITQKENLNLRHARKVLNEDHDAIDEVKDRIIEFIALGQQKGSTNGSILLLVGPPGVGKTSVGKSIARALNRPFFRFSVGGLRDESEIKGHRRTYIGAMPGKLVQALKQSKCMNPVIMLDEIDKISNSNMGNPSAALLEALDPEQNNSFMDHYIDLNVDLSKCLFICTANSIDTIPSALLDRMDKISLDGYLAQEKLSIAKHHLLPRLLKEANLTKDDIKIPDATIKVIIEDYAREAGVRHLEKLLAKIIRKVVVKLLDQKPENTTGRSKKKAQSENTAELSKGQQLLQSAQDQLDGQDAPKEKICITVTKDDLKEYLKSPLFRQDDHLQGVGVATGLAWTSMGGATIPVEAILINEAGAKLKITGSLGDVMKESAEIAYSFAASRLGYYMPKRKKYFDKANIHLHVPEGATPKDGPSAGITMTTALLSLAMNKAPVKGFAMTGELTLTGKVLAIGGIREKSMAAKRLGIKKLICPKQNENDVKDLPDFVKDKLEYHFVETYDDVARILFPSVFSQKDKDHKNSKGE